MLAVGILVVAGDGDPLGPVTAVAVGDLDDPTASADAPAIAERDAGRDGGEVVGFLAHLELEAGGAGFEAGSARAAGHGFSCARGSGECLGGGDRGRLKASQGI